MTTDAAHNSVREKAFSQAFFIFGERLTFLVPQAITILLITRFLGSEFFGKYAIVLTWITVFQLIANFGITECLTRELASAPELQTRFLSHGLLFSLLLSIIAMTVMGGAALALHYPGDITQALLLATVTLLPSNIVATCRSALLACRKIEYMMAVAILEALILLPLNVYWILTEAGLFRIIGTIVLARIVAGVAIVGLVHKYVIPITCAPQRLDHRKLWRTLFPFGVASLVTFPSLRFDVFLLSEMSTWETVGLYTAASKVMEILLVLPGAFYIVMLPRATRDLTVMNEQNTDSLQQAIRWYLAITIPLGLGVIIFAKQVLVLIYGAPFAESTLVLQIQMITFLLIAIDAPFALICKATGFQRIDMVFVTLSAGINLTLNVLLIPSLAAVGAGTAVALSILVQLILHWWFIRRSPVQFNWLIAIGLPLVISLLLVAIGTLLASRIPWVILAICYALAYCAIIVSLFKMSPLVHQAPIRIIKRDQSS